MYKVDVHTKSEEFMNNMLSSHYIPTISKPTRVTEFSATLIDNFFVSSLTNQLESAIVYNDISDHFPICLKINLNLNKHLSYDSAPKPFVYDKKRMCKFNTELQAGVHDLNLELSSIGDSNEAYKKFLNFYYNIFYKLLQK